MRVELPSDSGPLARTAMRPHGPIPRMEQGEYDCATLPARPTDMLRGRRLHAGRVCTRAVTPPSIATDADDRPRCSASLVETVRAVRRVRTRSLRRGARVLGLHPGDGAPPAEDVRDRRRRCLRVRALHRGVERGHPVGDRPRDRAPLRRGRRRRRHRRHRLRADHRRRRAAGDRRRRSGARSPASPSGGSPSRSATTSSTASSSSRRAGTNARATASSSPAPASTSTPRSA